MLYSPSLSIRPFSSFLNWNFQFMEFLFLGYFVPMLSAIHQTTNNLYYFINHTPQPLKKLINHSFQTVVFPSFLKTDRVMLIFKKDESCNLKPRLLQMLTAFLAANIAVNSCCPQ